jgi:hypothetical protein
MLQKEAYLDVVDFTQLHIGKSSRTQERSAVKEAVEMALSQCTEPQFGFVFSTEQYNPSILAKELNGKLNGLPWAGCTSPGVFARSEFLRKGLVIGLLSAKNIQIGIGIAKIDEDHSRQAGALAVADALSKLPQKSLNNIKSLIVLADAKVGNVSEVLRGAVQEAGIMNIWAGGGVGSIGQEASHSAEFAFGNAYSGHVLVIAFDSETPMFTGISHGWKPYGPPTMVTRSHGTVTEQLEYENAFEVYRQTAATHGEVVTPEEFAKFAITHPLGIPQASGEYVIRDPLDMSSDGSLHFVADLPDGCLVRVMQGGQADLLKAAWSAAHMVKDLSHQHMAGALIFDCVSRFMMLRQRYPKELETFQKGLGEAIPFLGCLTLGEVGSFGKGIPQFHNKTAVVMALTG